MDYTMEDTQNSAPDTYTMHEAAKLTPASRRPENQSVTKRQVTTSSPRRPPPSRDPNRLRASTLLPTFGTQCQANILTPTDSKPS